jgi:hypothetical protein
LVSLNAVRQETQKGARPQQRCKATKHLREKLDPFGRRLGRRELVLAIDGAAALQE